MKTVGEAILHFRTNRKKKVSQKELGLVIREKETAAQSIIRYFEIGKVRPKDEELAKIQEYLGITAEEFEDYMTKEEPLLVFHGVPVDERIFDIWPEGVQLLKIYQDVCEIGSENLIIDVIKEMANSLKSRTDEYVKERQKKTPQAKNVKAI